MPSFNVILKLSVASGLLCNSCSRVLTLATPSSLPASPAHAFACQNQLYIWQPRGHLASVVLLRLPHTFPPHLSFPSQHSNPHSPVLLPFSSAFSNPLTLHLFQNPYHPLPSPSSTTSATGNPPNLPITPYCPHHQASFLNNSSPHLSFRLHPTTHTSSYSLSFTITSSHSFSTNV